MELGGKVVVVTGGGSGIGTALATRFVAEGAAHVVVADLNGENAAQVASGLGPAASAVALDVADADAVQQLVADTETAHGPVDLFCSNAGIGGGVGLEDATPDLWQRLWDVNVMAHVHAANAVLPSMLARGDGYLLNTASAAGLIAQIGDPVYSVTKHAAVAFAEWLSITYGDRGVKVSCLCPQGVLTPMVLGNTDSPAIRAVLAGGNALEPEAVAATVVDGLRDERFLILPHAEVAEYMARRGADHERWLRGMRRLQGRVDP